MSGQRGISTNPGPESRAHRSADPAARGGLAASPAHHSPDRASSARNAAGVSASSSGVGQESHASLASDCQNVLGNSLIRAALAGTHHGPAAYAVDALALGASGVQGFDRVGDVLSNQFVQSAVDSAATEGPSLAVSAHLQSDPATSPDATRAVERALKRSGRPLPDALRAQMEHGLGGVDLSQVRIHTDGAAARAAEAVSAHAFAVGNQVVFNASTFRPHTEEGRRLIAHELQHVVQHQQGRIPTASGSGLSVSSPTDAHEREAERVAANVVRVGFDGSIDHAVGTTEAGHTVEAGAEAADAAHTELSRSVRGSAQNQSVEPDEVQLAHVAELEQQRAELVAKLESIRSTLTDILKSNADQRALLGDIQDLTIKGEQARGIGKLAAGGAAAALGTAVAGITMPLAGLASVLTGAIASFGGSALFDGLGQASMGTNDLTSAAGSAAGELGKNTGLMESGVKALGATGDAVESAATRAGGMLGSVSNVVGGATAAIGAAFTVSDVVSAISKAKSEYANALSTLEGNERTVMAKVVQMLEGISQEMQSLESMEEMLLQGQELISREPASREAAGPMARGATFAPPADSTGKALSPATLAALTIRLGRGVSRIRVHTGPAAARFAASLNANAVTIGQDIYFARGAWRPGSTDGDARIAHEAHHAIIGGGAPGVSQPGDAHEREATAFGNAFAASGGTRLLSRVGRSTGVPTPVSDHVQRRLDGVPAPSPSYSSFADADWTPDTTPDTAAPVFSSGPNLEAPATDLPATPAGDTAVWSREAAPAATSAAPSSNTNATQTQGPDPAAMAALMGQSADSAEAVVDAPVDAQREANDAEEGAEEASAQADAAATLEAAAAGEAEGGGESGDGAGDAGGPGAGATEPAAATGGDTPAPAPAALSADSAAGLVSAFRTASPTEKAHAWPTLGEGVAALAEGEGQEVSDNVPELSAEMSPEAAAATPSGSTDVEAPGGESAVAVEPEGAEVAPDIEATPALGSFQAGGTTPTYSTEDPDSAARAIGQALGSVPTRDGSVPTSPGPAPTVPLEGTTDPAQLATRLGDSRTEGTQAAQDARQAVLDSPGAERVQLQEVSEQFAIPDLTLPAVESTEAQSEMEMYVAMGLPADVQGAFDELNGPDMEASLAEAEAQATAAATERDASVQSEIDQAQADARAASDEAQRAQEDEVRRQRADIEKARADTITQQQQAVADVERRAASEHASRTSAINQRVAADQARIRTEYANAETQARAEVAEGERKAAEEKRKKEREAQNQSWWDRACDFVSSAIESLKNAISTIFNAVREAVTKVLDTVKNLASTIIDAAATFIKDAIRAFGDLLKGWIDDLLGDIFPGLAQALTDLVDSAVEYAESKIDQLAEGLKEAINKLVDGLHTVINAVLDLYEAALNTALSLAEAIVTGDWTELLLKALEAVLKLAGINPDEFYGLIGKAEDTIQSIIDDPGGFVGNVIAAVKGGFGQFADNFGTHLKTGFIDWLTGQAGDAGITMPDALDAKGIFSLVTQVLGLTKDRLQEKVEKHFGETAGSAFGYVWDSIEALVEGGVDGLYDKIAGDLDGLVDSVLGQIQEFLITKVVMAAVTKLATMFNPVGAIVQAVLTAWRIYEFLRDQISRIYAVVSSVVNSMADIAAGALTNAMNGVENALATLVPIAIDLLAKLLGLGGLGKKVRKVIEKVQKKVDDAIEKLIEKFKGMFKGGDKEGEEEEEGDWDGQIGQELSFTADGEGHRTWIQDNGGSPVVMVASTPLSIDERIGNWEGRLNDKPNDEHGKGGPTDKGQAQTLLGSARIHAQTVKSAAQQTADAEGEVRKAKDDATEAAQTQLMSTLQALFELYKDVDMTAIAESFSMNGTNHELLLNLEDDQILIDGQTDDAWKRLDQGKAVIARQIESGAVSAETGNSAIQNLQNIISQLKAIEPDLKEKKEGFRPHLRELSRGIATAIRDYGTQFKATDVINGLPVFPSAKAGTYSGLRGMAETAPDGSTQEAHHVPAKELAQAIARSIDDVIAENEDNMAASEAVSKLEARQLRIEGDQNGNNLSAILLHRVTHSNAGGLSVHATEIKDALNQKLDELEATTQQEFVRICTEAGVEAVNPSGKTFDGWMDAVSAAVSSRVQGQPDEVVVQAEDNVEEVFAEARLVLAGLQVDAKADSLSQFAQKANVAFTSAKNQGYSAVQIALGSSVLDGPKGDRDSALTQLQGRMDDDWKGIIGDS